jgi:hypothetical protein
MAGAIAGRDVEEHGLEFRRATELDLRAEYDLFELRAGLEAVPPESAALATLDSGADGFDRAVDHRFWGERAAQANLWLLGGEPIATHPSTARD